MRILLSNDDGWQAEGLGHLFEIANLFGEVWVVAPNSPQSGVSHQLTLDRPMELVERSPRFFSLEGTPADCTRIGLSQLGQQFDWVWSGINQGANLGSDIFVSGTVAAAREASFFGVPAIALSQYRLGMNADFDWSKTRKLVSDTLENYLSKVRSGHFLLNINFPDRSQDGDWDQAKLVECGIDPSPLPFDYSRCESGKLSYSGAYHQRDRKVGCDIDVCFSGNISVSQIDQASS